MPQDVAIADCLVLDGVLTMRSLEALCTTLRETIAHHSTVSIDCTAASEVDLCFIQLLVAARLSATQSEKTVALAAPPDGALLDALVRAGFRVTQEHYAGNAQAYWFEGAAA